MFPSSRNPRTATLFVTSWDTGFLLHGCLVLSYLRRVFPFKGCAYQCLLAWPHSERLPSGQTDANSSTQSHKQGVWATYCTLSCTLCHIVGRLGLAHTLCRVTLLLLLCWCAPQVLHWRVLSSSFLTCSPRPLLAALAFVKCYLERQSVAIY